MPFGHEKTGSAGRQPEILALQKALGYTPPPPAAPGTAPQGAGRGGPGFGRGVSPSGWSMEKEMLDYVIPYVEKEFRVIKDKDHRAIMGYSMGGGHATSYRQPPDPIPPRGTFLPGPLSRYRSAHHEDDEEDFGA